MNCFDYDIDVSSDLRSFMEDLRLSGTNRTSNAGTGPRNVPVESVQSRLEPAFQEYLPSSNVNSPYGNYHAVPLDTSNSTASFNSLTPSDMRCLATAATGFSYFRFMLSKNNPNIRRRIVKVVAENLFYLMQDPYGNKLFLHIIGTSSIDELHLFFAEMASQPESLIRVSKTVYGSSSVLKLIKDFKQSPFIRLIIWALAKGVYTLMTDKRGRQVIYNCLSLLDIHKKEILSAAVAQVCIPLSTHVLGCRSLNECIEFITDAPRDRLLDTIADYALFLANHPKGNYVLQNVLDLQNPIINDKIFYLLHGHYVDLSRIKVGSHVVETCLGTGGIHYVIKEFLVGDKILDLAKDEFGNYVVQKALSETWVYAPLTHQIMLSHLQQNIRSLKQHPFGRKVCSFLKRHYPAA